MKAAIVAVGSELLGTERLDTNSLLLTAALERYGVELVRKAVVPDVQDEIAAALGELRGRVELIVVSGGLGPTADDVTREAVAALLGRALVRDAGILAAIESRFAQLGWKMPAVNRKQADVIEGAVVLDNRRGTAPCLRLDPLPGEAAATLFLLPGVPAELAGLIDTALAPWLAARSGGVARETVVLKTACVPESLLEERIAPAYAEFGRESITILARPGEVWLQATAEGPEAERRARLQAMTARLGELAGDALFATGSKTTLEGVVGDLLRAAKATVVTAESCTGGLVAERLTRVAGSSDYFLGGVVSYTDDLKRQLLDVPAELLAAHGAVSEPVARAMASGVRRALGGDYAIAVTGVAGPGGGSAAKPVGTVHVAVAGPPVAGGVGGAGEDESGVDHRRVQLPGDRERVRLQSSQVALEMLRRRLLHAAAAPAVAAARVS